MVKFYSRQFSGQVCLFLLVIYSLLSNGLIKFARMSYAIDFYSGIGGWTLGMKLSGVTNLASYEWWNEANQTHNLNFGTNHKEVDIRSIDVSELTFDQKIDFIVGSPPCTQFSYANKGGNGDIADGMVDIYKFLEIVEHVKPKYWAMENVPRVAKILEKELDGGVLARFKDLVKVVEIVDSSHYGVPQRRKRMIAGNFPWDLFSAYSSSIRVKTLGDVLTALDEKVITDPNYGYSIARKKVTELDNEADLTKQEERINRDAKTFHPIYNGMSFPDKYDRPSRTVTATCTRVSRESIIVKSEFGYRRLSVRERGVLQGFPITYQYYGRTLNSKFKMIGNAVPPILTYYIFQAMKEVEVHDIKPPADSTYYHEQPKHKPFPSKLGLPKRKFPASRKFMYAVPNLRYGSGVRFELSNTPKLGGDWSFKFIYGNSKNIREVLLDRNMADAVSSVFNKKDLTLLRKAMARELSKHQQMNSKSLQKVWTSSTQNTVVFDFIDSLGALAGNLMSQVSLGSTSNVFLASILEDESKKIKDNAKSILLGLYMLSVTNAKLFAFENLAAVS